MFTQNCLGLKTDARIWQLLNSLQHRHTFAACLQETWRAGFAADTHCESGYTLVEWGPPLQQGRGSAGVAIALSRAAYAAWQRAGGEHWRDKAGRVLAIRFEARDPFTDKFVSVFYVSSYAPNSGMAQAEHDAHEAALDRVIANRKRGDVLIIGTDANASIGKGSLAGSAAECSAVGPYGTAHLNSAGRRLRTWMETHELVSLASYFRKLHYGTWLHTHVRRSYISLIAWHFIVARAEQRRFTDAGSCRGQLIGSDHRPVGCRVRIAPALERKPTADARGKLMRLDFSELREPRAQACFARSVVQRVQASNEFLLGSYAALADAVQEVAVERLPKRARVSSCWFAARAPQLQRLVDARNRRFDAHHRQPTSSSAVQLRQARSELEAAVSDAKSAWILGMCAQLSDGIGGKGSKAAWDVVGAFKRGLETARRPASAKMKFQDGSVACSAEENANVHAIHGKALYGRTAIFDATVLQTLRRRVVMPGLDHVPTEPEIRRCVSKLHDTAPGASGLPALVWKALMSTSAGYDLVEQMVHHFWATAEVPAAWETGLLAILFKKGDRSDPGNYRGIMLLETAYKIVGNLLLERLSVVKESLPHEPQCGFRGKRATMDATWTVKMLVKKRREHGLSTWLLFIDFVKAFDRCPRELMWEVLLIYGVPPLLVALLVALHEHVSVIFDVDGVRRVLESIICVKQGDLLGPDLFIFLMCAIMESWHAEHDYTMCEMRSARDFVLSGRRPTARGEDFSVGDSEYADDAALQFPTREVLDEQSPMLYKHFERWGMEMHAQEAPTTAKPAPKASKSEVLFCAAPSHCYSNPVTYDGIDLSNVQLPGGRSMPIVDEFCYLGSMITRHCGDVRDVDRRIESAGKAFGALRRSVFRSVSVTPAAKRAVYERLVLAIALFVCECWCLTEVLWRRLRCFHAQCLRAMCRISRKHTWEHHVSTQELGQRLGLESIDVYVARRQTRWLGHVRRMDFDRLPRKMLSSWVRSRRPPGCPSMTYGRSIGKSLDRLDIARDGWAELAADRKAWYAAIGGGKPPAQKHGFQPLLPPTPPPPPPYPPPPPPPPPVVTCTSWRDLPLPIAAPPSLPPPPPTPPPAQRTRRGRTVTLPLRLQS